MADAKRIDAAVGRWIKAIAQYEREFKRWEGRVEKIIKRYRDEFRNNQSQGSRFNILWSNVQTAIPAVYSRLPQPDVSRRFKDNDPVGRVASLLLERALSFEIEHYPDYRESMRECVQDRFLGGRGTSWVRYEPKFTRPDPDAEDDGAEGSEDESSGEQLDSESAPADYVFWKDFGHTIARTWDEVTGVWRKVYMGREALIARFGKELGSKIPLDTKPDTLKKGESGAESAFEAVIYEIWDKSERKALWLSKSMSQILDEKPDPLKLDNFWPCPRPLYATLTTDSLVPVPDFSLYQDQAATLDTISDRIEGLVKMLQVKGVHDAAQPEIGRLFTEGENGTLIPVKNWAAFVEKQGLRGSLDLVDLTPIFNALKAAYDAAEVQKQQIYEITGLADVIRGSSDPNETATAQKLKGNWGSMRLRAMQGDVAQFATELLQIKAQIMCGQFSPETLEKIGGAAMLSAEDQQYIKPALELLKQGDLRDFRIEIAADSMIYLDELQEKQDRMEMLDSSAKFLKVALEVGSQSPQLAPLLAELMKFGVTGFRVGKTIEGAFDQALDQLRSAAKQPQPQKPDPEMAKIQAGVQANAQELQQKAQYDQFKAQLDAQLAQAQQEAQARQDAQAQALEAQRDQQKMQLDSIVAKQQREFDEWKAKLEAATKVAVAEISAGAALSAAQLKDARAASGDGEIVDAAPAPMPAKKPPMQPQPGAA